MVLRAHEFVRAMSALVLTTPQGTVTMTRATPLVLQSMLLQLASATDQAQSLIDQLREYSLGTRVAESILITRWMALAPQERDRQLGQMQDELDRWIKRLDHYLQVTNDCVASGRLLDWQCTLFEVGFPLLLGWYPNDAGDAIDPTQEHQELADMAAPFLVIGQALELGAFMDWQGFTAFLYAMLEVTIEAVVKAGDAAAEALVRAAQAAIENALKHPDKPAGKLARWAIGLAAGAAVVGGIWIFR